MVEIIVLLGPIAARVVGWRIGRRLGRDTDVPRATSATSAALNTRQRKRLRALISIAFECAQGWLHINSDWVILEPVDTDYQAVWERVEQRLRDYLATQGLPTVHIVHAPEPPQPSPTSGKFRQVWRDEPSAAIAHTTDSTN